MRQQLGRQVVASYSVLVGIATLAMTDLTIYHYGYFRTGFHYIFDQDLINEYG